MSPVTTSDLPALLTGLWRLTRRIEDARAGETHLMEGEASFSADGPARLDYRETGTLHSPAGTFQAERAMIWHFTAGAARVAFADGRLFHALELEGGICTARHECGDDLYLGQYDFRDRAAWRVRWRVSGPRKDYRSDSLHTRLR